MGANLSGLPKSDVQASDISTLVANSLGGRFCVQLPLERGEMNVPVLITTTDQLLLQAGTYLSGTKGWIMAQLALDAGSELYVSRMGHYTNIYDKSTLVGSKTTGNITKTVVAETKASATFTVTNVGEDGNTFSLFADTKIAMIALGSYVADVGSDTDDDVAAGLRFAINALTGTHGFIASGSGDDVDIDAPVGTGAAANNYLLKKTVQGTSDGTISQFAGGVTQVASGDAGVITFEGKNIGPAYNASIQITPAASGDVTKVDLLITLPGYDKATEPITDINRTPSALDIQNLNKKSNLINVLTVTTRIPYGTVSLTGGVYDISLIDDNDVIGTSSNNTGIYSFNSITDAQYISNFEWCDNIIDSEIINYCAMRKDMRALLRMPFGLTIQQSKDYRNQTGAYANGILIDSFWGRYVYGDVGVIDPNDKTNTIELSGIGLVCGARAKADQQGGQWISDSGSDYPLTGIKYLLYNYGDPGLIGLADDAYENASGINPIINHPSFGFVLWGNRSLLRDKTKLTSKENIANMMVPIIKFLKVAADKQLFKPNDPITWNALYREAKQFITGTLEPKRAITPTEKTGWFWVGDQDANSVDDVKFNIKSEIQAGKYRARFIFQPIASLEYIAIEATATDAANLQVAIDNAA